MYNNIIADRAATIRPGDRARLQVSVYPFPSYDFCKVTAIENNPFDPHTVIIWYEGRGNRYEDILGRDERVNILRY